MFERNETHYQLDQENKVFILTTSLIGDKIKLMCRDSNNQIYKGIFNMNDLLKISRYFSTTNSVEQVQIYLNGIIENQRIGIFFEGNILKMVLYLVNNDKISIPLTKVSTNNNNLNIMNQYLINQSNSTAGSSTNYIDANYYSDQIGNISYYYQQKPNDYINNINSQPYYIEQNNNRIINTTGVDFSIPDSHQINNANNQILPSKYITSNANNMATYQDSDLSNNFNYNIEYNEKKIGKLEDETNIIKLEQEKIKNEMKKVQDEVIKLRKENDFYKTENSSLINENKTLKNENEHYKEELINYQNEIKQYKEENNTLRNQLTEIQNDSKVLQNKNDELLKMKDLYENENKITKNNLEEIGKENELLKEEIKNLKNENESLSNDINILNDKLINQQKTSINEDEIKRLIEENSVFRIKAQENELLKKQIEDLQYQIQMEQEKQEYDESKEVKGDIIHDGKELDMIIKKINKENKKIIINLLYKASADGDTASAFHEKCDDANSTIVLVETKDGMRFGGYTTCSWSGNCVDKNDSEAFIFSFDKMKTYDNIPGDEAIGCYPKFGPIFLGCQIKIFDNAFTKGGTTYEKELNFNTEEDYELTGGKRSFEIKDIEVYEVIFE
jgi:hypothetical protein